MPAMGGGWWHYPRYAPARPRPVKDGIRTRSKRGDIGSKWWSRRWVAVLESFGMGARLGRGRSYARRGQVVSIDVAKGLVEAKVQGTRPRPYEVTIALRPLTDAQWAAVTEALARRAAFAASLLSGEMPEGVEEAFREAGSPLFPERRNDLDTDCSCPDWANPCKHIAAVYMILGERFDDDPFLIFQLRGRTRDELVRALRAARARAGAAPAPGAEGPAEGAKGTVADGAVGARRAGGRRAGAGRARARAGVAKAPQAEAVTGTSRKRAGPRRTRAAAPAATRSRGPRTGKARKRGARVPDGAETARAGRARTRGQGARAGTTRAKGARAKGARAKGARAGKAGATRARAVPERAGAADAGAVPPATSMAPVGGAMPAGGTTPPGAGATGFWHAGEGLDSAPVRTDALEGEGAVLGALGPSPLTVRGEDLRDVLARAYATAGEAARRRLAATGTDDRDARDGGM